MDFDKIISVLKEGGIVTHPTDTCYGLACDPFNKKAVERLYELKKMPKDKPLTWMVGSLHEAEKFANFSLKAMSLASEWWPGDLTLVLPKKEGEGFQGLRVPGDEFSQEILKRWGGPLITTSANLSGESAPYDSDDALRGDYVVEEGTIERNTPSTVVKVVDEDVEVLRQGRFNV